MRLHSLLLSAVVLAALAACSTTKVPPRTNSTQPATVIDQQFQMDQSRIVNTQSVKEFADMPGWKTDNLVDAFPALLSSCTVLIRRPGWENVCQVAQRVDATNSNDIRRYFEQYFKPYQLKQANGQQTGLVTGYYEPLLRGARYRHAQYQTPLYGLPSDLISVGGKKTQEKGRKVGGRVVPYWTRAEIVNNQRLVGSEIVWVDDSVDAFFMQVQGSGRVFLPETGQTIRLAFVDHNGQPYKSIGKYLVDKGELTLSQASAQGIKDWIKANPSRENELFNVNPRYVFFKEVYVPDPEHGPRGAMNVPLTPERSIAIDPAYIPLGVPVFLDTTFPNTDVPLRRLVFAQDTGSAIKGGVRADYFWGFGDGAGDLAGAMKQQGKMWVLLPK